MSSRNLSSAALAVAALLALLGPARGSAGPAEERAAAEAELRALAPRIEQLKVQAAAGHGSPGELTRLLSRAQALAEALERSAPPPPATPSPAAGPDPQELRERADAARDRADKAAVALAEVDRQLAEAVRRAELADRLEALGAADLFGDGITGRTAAGGAVGAGASAAGGTTPTAGPGSVGGASGTTPAPALRSAAEPGGARPLAGPEEAGALRRRRAELTRALAAARAEAAALDAEARAADGR